MAKVISQSDFLAQLDRQDKAYHGICGMCQADTWCIDYEIYCEGGCTHTIAGLEHMRPVGEDLNKVYPDPCRTCDFPGRGWYRNKHGMVACDRCGTLHEFYNQLLDNDL